MAENVDRDWRDPFLALFVLGALALIVLVSFARDSSSSNGTTFAADRSTPVDVVTAQPLPQPSPTAPPESAPAEISMSYAADAIMLRGELQAQPIADAVVAAAEGIVGADAVTNELLVNPDSTAQGARLTIDGEVADDDERTRVVSAFASTGVEVRDALIIAGSDRTLLDVIAEDPSLSQFNDFLAASGVAAELQAEGESFTIFAPTNAAIEALDTAALRELADVSQLAEVTRFHILAAARSSSDLSAVGAVSTLQGESLAVLINADGTVSVAGVTPTIVDILATNGVIHVIGEVLLPGTLATEIALNRVVELDPVQFGVGSAEILDASTPILEQAAQLLIDNPVGSVEIQGHTDTDGQAETNLELSQERADAVRDFLIAQGVAPDRITAVGYGETILKADPEETDEDKALNRRIEFRVN